MSATRTGEKWPNRKQDLPDQTTRPGRRPQRRRPARAAAAATLLKIVDRKSGKEPFISADGSAGPAVRLADDWGDFAYQWRIPFQAFAEWPGLRHDPGKAIGIGLLWKITPLPGLDKTNPGRSGQGPGRGGRSGPPPGMTGGRSGAGRGLAGSDFKSRRQDLAYGRNGSKKIGVQPDLPDLLLNPCTHFRIN